MRHKYVQPPTCCPIRNESNPGRRAGAYLEVQVDFVGAAQEGEVASALEEGAARSRVPDVQRVARVLLHRAVVVRLHARQTRSGKHCQGRTAQELEPKLEPTGTVARGVPQKLSIGNEEEELVVGGRDNALGL